MKNLTITVSSKYNIRLFVDGNQILPDEKGKYNVQLDEKIPHSLKITSIGNTQTAFPTFKQRLADMFKIKGRFDDRFDNLFCEAQFVLISKHINIKLFIEVKEEKWLNFNKRETFKKKIVFFENKDVDILDVKSTVFADKKQYWTYFFRHRWIETILFLVYVYIYVRKTITLCNLYSIDPNMDIGRLHSMLPFGFLSQKPLPSLMDSITYLIIATLWYTIRTYGLFKKSKDLTGQSDDMNTGDGSVCE